MLNPALRDWRRQRVWLIGASSGIGAATAHALLARGAQVAVSARRAGQLQALAATAPGQALALPLDVTDAAQWEAACTRLIADWGGVDLVLFMAASYRPCRVWELEAEPARRLIETNLTGVSNGLSALLPQLLRQRHGGIGLVASVAGYRGLPQAQLYGATKAALINLAETLYLELRPRGIGVYLINPGFVRTPLTADNPFPMPALLEPEQAAAAILRGIERGRFEISFPRRFTGPLRLLRLLPYRLYFPLIHRITGL